MDFEIKIIEFLQAGRSQFFDVSFQLISLIGSSFGIIFLCLLFLFSKKMRLCFWFLFSCGFIYLAVSLLKSIVQRTRPFNFTDTIVSIGDSVTGYSFPSNHAACATAIAIFLCWFLFGYFKKKSTRVEIVLSCCLYVGLVCLSRMYLGKHYLTDLLAGVVISAIICILVLTLMHYVQKEKKVKSYENKNGN
jgi:undecaprenyl-diphosphatase